MSDNRRIGLALSGGGFRATLFHLGVIRCLRDVGLLKDVTVISSVSGGSIMAAHLALRWDDYTADVKDGKPDRFNLAAAEIVKLAALDIRGRIVRWTPITIPTLLYRPGMAEAQRIRWTRDRLFQILLDRHLYHGAEMGDVKQNAPDLYVVATNMFAGRLASFSRGGLRFELGKDKKPDEFHDTSTVPISLAVAASAAFPGLIPPIAVTGPRLNLQGELNPKLQHLTDGGVFDNLGVRKLELLEKDGNFSHVIVSDAGGQFNGMWTSDTASLAATTARVSDLLLKRIAELERERTQTVGLNTNNFSCKYIEFLITEIVDDNEQHFIQDIQQQLPFLRTDLDFFSKLERRTLIRHGFCVGEKILRKERLFDGKLDIWDLYDQTNERGKSKEVKKLRRGRYRRLRLFSFDLPTTLYATIIVALAFYMFGDSIRNYLKSVPAAKSEVENIAPKPDGVTESRSPEVGARPVDDIVATSDTPTPGATSPGD